jgi:hypothetical protein
MPIVERDPWRQQYFEGVACPEDLVIPTDDETAYVLFPDYRWVYNKLLICEAQGIAAAPHGVPPESFPVFSKPIYNMFGMGVAGRVIEDAASLASNAHAGHMWMELLQGEHLSSDVALVGGEAQWWRHTSGAALEGGAFDYWTVLAEQRPELERYCETWLRQHLRGYTGMANLETIGGRIIETHLRFADQWPDLYGEGWLDAVVELYARRRWRYEDGDREMGFSVVLFGAHGVRYTHPPAALVEAIVAREEISSVQVTFHEALPSEQHHMPPGGFRLAVINCTRLDAGLRAREELALSFWSAQNLGGTGV